MVGIAVTFTVAEVVVDVAWSVVSVRSARVLSVPVAAVAILILAVTVPSVVPLAIGVAWLEVHVSTVVPATLHVTQPDGDGVPVNFSPVGSVTVSFGS